MSLCVLLCESRMDAFRITLADDPHLAYYATPGGPTLPQGWLRWKQIPTRLTHSDSFRDGSLTPASHFAGANLLAVLSFDIQQCRAISSWDRNAPATR
jgi:hypothetical protein